MIAHTVRAALGSRLLSSVVVSTDSEDIAAVCRDFGLEVPWLRPAEIAGDATRMQEVAFQALDQHPQGSSFDYLLLLQPTSPFRIPEDIDAAIELAVRYDADTVTSFVFEDDCHPYYMYRYEPGLPGEPARVTPFIDYEPGMLQQEFPPCVHRNGAIYLVRRQWFIENNSFVAPDGVPYMMPPERSVNINTPEDIAYAEFLISRRGGSRK